MSVSISLIMALLLSGTVITAIPILRRFLHFYQQEEYDFSRYLPWWIRTRSFERRATLVTLVAAIISFVVSAFPVGLFIVSIGFMAVIAFVGFTNKPINVKKALVMTPRAKRIFSITLVVLIADLLSGYYFVLWLNVSNHLAISLCFILAAIAFQAAPLYMILANWLLKPVESHIQKGFLNEAKRDLQRIKPEVIGITGSYGKTSIKHILSHVLNAHAPTLATPGSVNTLMGITRIIRERLKNNHLYFIVEMGAYGVGSIKKICGLTPPSAAIVTAVGYAHLERFKTIETVAQAKSELPQAVPEKGWVILNGDDPYVRAMVSATKATVRFYGKRTDLGHLDCQLLDSAIIETGTQITLLYDEKEYTIDIPLYGHHQAQNAVGAFLLAVSLGVPAITAVASLRDVPQIDHRLVVRRGADGIIMIDDAYNSNPSGFAAALEVMQALKGENRILVTPGMVELGGRDDEEHRAIAEQAAKICSHIALVAPQRVPALRDGLLENGFQRENLHEFETLQDARAWLQGFVKFGDIVLFENDLPDLYESATAFRLF